jgi:hypothetical protein
VTQTEYRRNLCCPRKFVVRILEAEQKWRGVRGRELLLRREKIKIFAF